MNSDNRYTSGAHQLAFIEGCETSRLRKDGKESAPPEKKEGATPQEVAPNAHKINTPKQSDGVNLPEIQSIDELLTAKLPERPEVIKGILRQRCKMGLGGAAKARKTWQLIDLAISLASGKNWLAFETVKCRVVYVNLELYNDTFRDRFQLICNAKGVRFGEIKDQCI